MFSKSMTARVEAQLHDLPIVWPKEGCLLAYSTTQFMHKQNGNDISNYLTVLLGRVNELAFKVLRSLPGTQ